MQNMIMGMRTLNITQGYNSTGSHKNLLAWDLGGEDSGIDTFRAKNYLKVLAVLSKATTGFANTVIFGTSDQYGNPAYVHTPRLGDQILSIAMSHDNVIASKIKVGAVFGNDEMIYEEGTVGDATGNHIHLEVGLGWQYKKVHLYGNYYKGSVWCLQNLVKPEDAIFLLEGYNRVFNNRGYGVQWCNVIDGGDKLMIAYGLNEVTWNNNKVWVYKQDPSYEDIGLISAPGDHALQTIDKIDDARTHDAKMNAGYFVMNGDGQHLGVEQSPQLNLVPRQNKNYLALWITTDNEPHFDYSDNYWLNPPHDVKMAITPACIMLFNGEDTDIISTGLGDKRTLLNSQSMFLRFEDGAYGFAVTTNNNWNAYNCRQFAKDYGCTMCALMDSGGSTQMIVNGKKVVYTGRAIANVLTIYRTETGSKVWPDTDEPTDTTDWKAKYEECVVELDTRTKERDDAIEKYNDLAVDYDECVADNRKLTDLMSNINSHVQDINELIEEYNNDEQ